MRASPKGSTSLAPSLKGWIESHCSALGQFETAAITVVHAKTMLATTKNHVLFTLRDLYASMAKPTVTAVKRSCVQKAVLIQLPCD